MAVYRRSKASSLHAVLKMYQEDQVVCTNELNDDVEEVSDTLHIRL